MRDQRLRQRFERARAQGEDRRLESNPDSHAGIPEDTGAPRSRGGAGSARGSGVGCVRACQPGSASDGRLPASPAPLRAPGDSRGCASRPGALGVGAHGAASSSSPPTSPRRVRRAPRCSWAHLEPSFLPAGPAQPLTSLLPGPGPVPTSRPTALGALWPSGPQLTHPPGPAWQRPSSLGSSRPLPLGAGSSNSLSSRGREAWWLKRA